MILSKKILFNHNDLNIELRTLQQNDVKESYLEGLREEKKYLLNVPNEVTLSSQRKYINEIINSENNTICGLLVNGELVGTAGV